MSHKKRRMNLKINDDDAVVVAPLPFWDRLEEWLLQSAEEFPEQAEGWIAAAEHVREWVENTTDSAN